MKVYINCRSSKTLHPTTLESIRNQSIPTDIELVESHLCPTRLSLLKNCKSGTAIFLDEDIVLPKANFLEELHLFLNQNQDVQFLTGHYISDQKADYLQKSYNWMTNLWTFPVQSGVSVCQNAPGGFWAVRSELADVCSDWSEPATWGGEDTRAIRFLQSKGVEIYVSPSFGVLHYPRSNLIWFLKRAYQQGQAKQKWNLESKIQSPQLCAEMIKNMKYVPALLLHQLAVQSGAFLEKVRSWIASTSPVRPETK
jgi:hypothetical protein